MLVAKDDLGIGADIDDQRQFVVQMRRLAQNHAGGIRADMSGNAGKDVGARRWVGNIDGKLARPEKDWLVRGKREWRAAKLGRVDAEKEMVHHGIADEGQIHNLIRIDHRFGSELANHGGDRFANGKRHLLIAAWIHHDVADPAHEVFAETDLRVHQAGRRNDFTGAELDQMAGDRGRADVEGNAVDLFFEAGPDRNNALIGVDHGGHAPIRLAERLLQILHHPKVGAETGQLPLLFERALQPQ